MTSKTSKSLLNRFSVAENEYFAEQVVITIVPFVAHPIFRFISGTFGPLEEGIECNVPLWLALILKKRGKCKVLPPTWMSPTALQEAVEHERTQKSLGKLPFHYLEIAILLLQHAKDDLDNSEMVSSLLQDVENIRMDRIRLGISSVAETVNKDEPVVSAALNQAGRNIPSGKVENGSSEQTFRTIASYQTIDEIRNMVIRQSNGGQSVTVGDLAEVVDSLE
ncbi:hypothetical protein EON65_42615, partial [archaeon]